MVATAQALLLARGVCTAWSQPGPRVFLRGESSAAAQECAALPLELHSASLPIYALNDHFLEELPVSEILAKFAPLPLRARSDRCLEQQ